MSPTCEVGGGVGGEDAGGVWGGAVGSPVMLVPEHTLWTCSRQALLVWMLIGLNGPSKTAVGDPPDESVPVDEEDGAGGEEGAEVLGGQVVGHLGGGSNNPLGHFHLQLFPALNCSFVCLFWLRSSMCSLFCTEH